MNRVGEGGKGESVWLGWLLLRTIELFAPFADSPRSGACSPLARACRHRSQLSLERDAWDGEWYRRATFDDGTLARLGARARNAGSIPSRSPGRCCPARPIPRAPRRRWHRWTSTSSAATTAWLFCSRRHSTRPGAIPATSRAIRRACARTAGSTATPRCGRSSPSPSSARATRPHELFALAQPDQPRTTPEEVDRYKVEPYVVAADVYSVAPHVGRGGWTWYTGSAGWMYRAGIEGILGIRREGGFLVIAPSLPAAGRDLRPRLPSAILATTLVWRGRPR